MATFDAYLQSLTLHRMAPNVYDGVMGGNFLTNRLFMNAKSWGGETVKVAFMYRKNTSGQWYDGMDSLSTARVNTRLQLSFEPRWFSQSVVVAGTDLDVNNTKEGIIKLLGVEMETAKISMADTVGDAFYTLQAGKAPLSLLDVADDATDVTTYGGASRSTYSALNGQRNAAGGVLTTTLMGTLYDDCSSGTIHPNLITAGEAVWRAYEGLLQPTIVNNIQASGYSQATADGVVASKQALGGDIGFDSLFYTGHPVVRDEKVPTQNLFMIPEDYVAWYSLPSMKWTQVSMGTSVIEGPYKKSPPSSLKLYWSGLREPTSQDAEIGFFKIGGQLIGTNPRFVGRLTGITG